MYQINDYTYALEDDDIIKFVRDGGGNLFFMYGTDKYIIPSGTDYAESITIKVCKNKKTGERTYEF